MEYLLIGLAIGTVSGYVMGRLIIWADKRKSRGRVKFNL